MLDMFPFNVRDYDVFEGNEEGSNVALLLRDWKRQLETGAWLRLKAITRYSDPGSLEWTKSPVEGGNGYLFLVVMLVKDR